MQQLKLVEDNRQHLAVDLDQLLLAAEEQFLKRNISVVEFVDLYSSYRDTNFMMEDGKAQLFKSNEELKKIRTMKTYMTILAGLLLVAACGKKDSQAEAEKQITAIKRGKVTATEAVELRGIDVSYSSSYFSFSFFFLHHHLTPHSPFSFKLLYFLLVHLFYIFFFLFFFFFSLFSHAHLPYVLSITSSISSPSTPISPLS